MTVLAALILFALAAFLGAVAVGAGYTIATETLIGSSDDALFVAATAIASLVTAAAGHHVYTLIP